ncbi:hypothetical protein ACFYZN_37765 [Streptomyces sp. NPDC001777]|uniref:hypothetical protein n=1 Tax=Streptomyces sp. NPDC001777 TaxID=3364608 RepID=UPI00367BDE69
MLDTCTGAGTTGAGSPAGGSVREGARRGTPAPAPAAGDGAAAAFRKAANASCPALPVGVGTHREHGRLVEHPEAAAA